MEIVIQLGALILTFILAAVKTAQYVPNGTSDFELERQVADGHAQAIAEKRRRALLPAFGALKTFKEVILTVALLGLLISTRETGSGILLGLLYLFVAEVITAKGILAAMVQKLQQKVEPRISHHVEQTSKIAKVLTPTIPTSATVRVASRQELQSVIEASGHVLTAAEKDQLVAGLTLSNQTLADIMVPAEQIITVDAKETVGPVLLDRLHKAGHKIFPVVKKDLQHVKGLLYMGDVVQSRPDVEKVADATRPGAYYLPQDASLTDVISASLQTGRQFFLIRSSTNEIVGLVTLRDVLSKMLGRALPAESRASREVA